MSSVWNYNKILLRNFVIKSFRHKTNWDAMASCYGRGDMILPLTKQSQSGEEEGHRPILGLENDGSIMAANLKIRENSLYSSYIFLHCS